MCKKRIFGTFGVRREANKEMNPEFASKMGASYGTVVQGTVAIGGDTRTSTPMLKHAITAGLLSSGCDVVDLGILPTPAIQYAVRNYYDAGIIITASHNPPHDNGIKLVDEYGIGTSDETEIKVEELYFNEKPKRASWNEIGQYYTNNNIINEYITEAIKRVDSEAIKNAKLKVVVDTGSGAGSYTAPYLLRKLGCDVTTINCQADGHFPGRNPEPVEENLQDLISTVKELNADLGIAHDGDADRTICIDELGNFILGDKTFTLVEKAMLKENNGGLIVTTVATSSAIYDIAAEYNSNVISTPVGDLNVARKLKEHDGLFGGEENGGLIFPDFIYGRDAAMTVCKILEIIAKEKKPISELIAELPVYHTVKTKTPCPDNQKEKVMAKIAEEIEKTTEYKLDTTDGVKILRNDGWVIIRPSGTEPIFRCFAETDNIEKSKEIANWGLSLIKKYLE